MRWLSIGGAIRASSWCEEALVARWLELNRHTIRYQSQMKKYGVKRRATGKCWLSVNYKFVQISRISGRGIFIFENAKHGGVFVNKNTSIKYFKKAGRATTIRSHIRLKKDSRQCSCRTSMKKTPSRTKYPMRGLNGLSFHWNTGCHLYVK